MPSKKKKGFSPKEEKSAGKFIILVLLIFTPILLVLGIFLLAITAQEQLEAHQSLTWPSTEGTVTGHSIDQHVHEGDNDYGPDTVITHYVPIVTYEYTVKANTFSSDRIKLWKDGGYDEWSKAGDYLSQYPLGSHLTVFYNPEKPERSLIERTIPDPTLNYGIGTMTLLMGLAGFVILLIAIRQLCLERGQPDAWKHWSFWKELVPDLKFEGWHLSNDY